MSAFLWIGFGVLTFGAGWVAGRRQRLDLCGCGCRRAVHDPATGACRGVVPGLAYDEFNEPELMPCPCQQYIGVTR